MYSRLLNQSTSLVAFCNSKISHNKSGTQNVIGIVEGVCFNFHLQKVH